jgi:hypothetical protein
LAVEGGADVVNSGELAALPLGQTAGLDQRLT